MLQTKMKINQEGILIFTLKASLNLQLCTKKLNVFMILKVLNETLLRLSVKTLCFSFMC